LDDSDQLLENYIIELCKKLQKKIELNSGQRFRPLNSEKNIDSLIQLLKANNLYDKIITEDLVLNKRALNLAYVGFRLGIAQAATNRQKRNRKTSPGDILNIQKNSYLHKYRYCQFKSHFINIVSNLTNDPNYKNKSLRHLVSISKSIPDRYVVSLSQEMSRLNLRFLKKLENPPSIITDEDVEEYYELYDKGCKCLEKYIKISFKFVTDIKGNTKIAWIRGVQNRGVYGLKGKLEFYDYNFKKLLVPFSTIIWDSIKHGEKIKDPSSRKITFQSDDGRRICSYSSFIRMVGELFTVLFLLSRFSHYLLLTKLQEYSG
jgi:hypothetical protein